MTNEEVAVRLEDHEHEIGSLKHRMKSVEEVIWKKMQIQICGTVFK